MKKVKLTFMVVPEELATKAYVPRKVKLKIINCEKMFKLGILGDSGKEMARNGFLWYFEKSLAEMMIDEGIAKKVL
jgi:hypothetical protein